MMKSPEKLTSLFLRLNETVTNESYIQLNKLIEEKSETIKELTNKLNILNTSDVVPEYLISSLKPNFKNHLDDLISKLKEILLEIESLEKLISIFSNIEYYDLEKIASENETKFFNEKIEQISNDIYNNLVIKHIENSHNLESSWQYTNSSALTNLINYVIENCILEKDEIIFESSYSILDSNLKLCYKLIHSYIEHFQHLSEKYSTTYKNFSNNLEELKQSLINSATNRIENYCDIVKKNIKNSANRIYDILSCYESGSDFESDDFLPEKQYILYDVLMLKDLANILKEFSYISFNKIVSFFYIWIREAQFSKNENFSLDLRNYSNFSADDLFAIPQKLINYNLKELENLKIIENNYPLNMILQSIIEKINLEPNDKNMQYSNIISFLNMTMYELVKTTENNAKSIINSYIDDIHNKILNILNLTFLLSHFPYENSENLISLLSDNENSFCDIHRKKIDIEFFIMKNIESEIIKK